MKKSKPLLSIIIVNYNTKALLKQCLKSVASNQPSVSSIEIIVVDNGSDDGSREYLGGLGRLGGRKELGRLGRLGRSGRSRKKISFRLIQNKKNLGFAKANNQGAEVARGEHILFLNSDTVLNSSSLTKPLQYIKNHPKVGALTIKLCLPNGQIDPDNHRGYPTPFASLTYLAGLPRLFPRWPLFNRYHLKHMGYQKIHRIPVAAGSFLMMPTKLFHQIGGWDEAYFFYGEDIDLCYRINQAGYKIIYYPYAQAVHLKGGSSGLKGRVKGVSKPSRQTRIRAAQASVKAMEIFYRKFYAQKYPRWLTGLVLMAIKVKGKLRIFKYKFL